MSAKNKSNELKLTRVYDAPVKAVWEAWVDPKQAAKWWGPRGFTITTHSKELKVGGHWHYTMHGPDGTDYPNKTVYYEVEKHQRLVYDHGGNDEQKPLFRVTVQFTEVGKKTQMDMTMTMPSAEALEQTKKIIKTAGGNSTWDRLGEYLEKEISEKEVFIINRSFEAPIETLFEMWIDPKHLSQWLGPANVTMDFIEQNIAEGKTSFYKMTYENGVAMYAKINYLKIRRHDLLEYTQNFCDEKGNLSTHPNVPTWPKCMHTQVLLTKEDDGNTRVTVTWGPQGDVTKEELQAFAEMRAGMTQGWTQSFDKLEEYLK